MEAKDAKEEDGKVDFEASEIEYESYGGEHHLPLIMNLVDEELSEPYSIFTYRYFVYLWPHLSFLVRFYVSFPCSLNSLKVFLEIEGFSNE